MLRLTSRVHHSFTFALAAAVCALLLAGFAGAQSGVSARAAVNGSSPTSALGTTVEGVGGSIAPNATTIPHWQGSFTSGGVTYPYTMVGTDPAAGSLTTTIPVELIPLRFVFSSGDAYDASPIITPAVQSPVFQPAQFASGYTQYGDAMLRADFWGDVSTVSPNWHVLLDQPTVYPVQTIVVPGNRGTEIQLPSYTSVQTFGLVNDHWLNTQLNALISSMHIPPTTLPIFLSYDAFSTFNGSCCSLGFHNVQGFNPQTGGLGNGVEPINTMIFAVYTDPGFAISFGPQYANVADITGLSHEVAEWLSDPLIANQTPHWTAPFYGCSSLLEVGDPLVAFEFPVTMSNGLTYYPQDAMFVPWYARSTAPSGTLGSQYDYLGVVNSLSPC